MSRIAEQRRQAAALGTEVRSRRAAVKRRIASGQLELPWILRDPSPPQRGGIACEIAVGQLLRSVPGIGPKIASEIIADLQLNPTRPLGEMPLKERQELAVEIERT